MCDDGAVIEFQDDHERILDKYFNYSNSKCFLRIWSYTIHKTNTQLGLYGHFTMLISDYLNNIEDTCIKIPIYETWLLWDDVSDSILTLSDTSAHTLAPWSTGRCWWGSSPGCSPSWGQPRPGRPARPARDRPVGTPEYIINKFISENKFHLEVSSLFVRHWLNWTN